jgi:hypothetical protein
VTPWREQARALVMLVVLFPLWLALLTLTVALLGAVLLQQRVDAWLTHRRIRRYLAHTIGRMDPDD